MKETNTSISALIGEACRELGGGWESAPEELIERLITKAFHAGEDNLAEKCMTLFAEAPEEMGFEELAQTTKRMIAVLEAARQGDKENNL